MKTQYRKDIDTVADNNPVHRKNRMVRPWHIAFLATIGVTLLLLYIIAHPELVIDSFIKNRITEAIHEAYPQYSVRIAHLHYHILENRLDCDSLSMVEADSSEEFMIATMSVSGVSRWHLLRGREISMSLLGNASAYVQGVVIKKLRPQYELHCAAFTVSVADSSLLVQSLDIQPSKGDEEFFAQTAYRSTLFRLAILECRINGADCIGFLRGTEYRARVAHVTAPSLSVLVNKAKPVNPNAPPPRMPSEILSSIKAGFCLDSIDITDANVLYGERLVTRGPAGTLTFDGFRIHAEGLGNAAGGCDTLRIASEGLLQSAGAIGFHMGIPVASPDLSYHYSGFLEKMKASKLNSFCEITESKRIKSGMINSIKFDVNVDAGKATGSVNANYTDFKIEVIDAGTQRRGGIFNDVISFIANTFKLRTSNVQDKSGQLKAGVVKLTKHSDETFLQFSWFAIRSGLKDLVGF